MGKFFDPFTPLNFGDLFTMMWVGAFVILAGSVVVYNAAQRVYRRYPAILSLHEWVFWSIFATWLVVPLLVVIHVPLALLLLLCEPRELLADVGELLFPELAHGVLKKKSEVGRQRSEKPKPSDI